MSFLSSVTLPNANPAPSGSSTTPPNSGGSFLKSVQMPTPQQSQNAQNIQTYSGEEQVAKANSDYTNSFSGILNNAFVQPAKDYINSSIDQVKTVGSRIASDPLGSAYDAFEAPTKKIGQAASQSFGQAVDAGSNMINDYKNGTGSSAGDVANLANVASGVAGTLFSPITGLFNTAQSVPGLKQVADAINVPLSAAGVAGAYGTGKILDILPISQQSKDVLRSPLQQLGSLALQVGLGGKIMDFAGDYIKKGVEITPDIAQKIVDKAQGKTATPQVKGGFLESVQPPESAPTVPESRLAQTHAEYAKSMGYEPYTPDSELPAIQMGTKAKGTIPSIQTEEPVGAPSGLKYEPISQEPTVQAPSSPTVSSRTAPSEPLPVGTAKGLGDEPIAPAESTGATGKSKLASSVDTNAIERKLTEGLGNTPEYNKVNMKEQAQFASDLITNEPDKAMRIAMGQEPPPAHILPEAVFTAVEAKAVKEGDIDTLTKLATESNMSSQATAMGQRIRALGERDDASPINIIKNLSDERKAFAEKKANKQLKSSTENTVSRIREEIKATASKRPNWEEFVQQLSCNI